jgi:hypothetical protein
VASLGDYLVLRGDLVEAVRLFSWAHTRARRTGLPWPPRPTTQEFLDAAAAGLTADEPRGPGRRVPGSAWTTSWTGIPRVGAA